MTTPLVQATTFPSDDPYAKGNYALAAEEGGIYEASSSGPSNHEKQTAFQDVPWAILFLAHLVAMIVVISINFSFGGDGGGGDEAEAGDEYSDLYALLGPMVATSAVMPILLSCVSLRAMITHPTELIKASLFVTLGINLIMAIVGFVLGFLWLGIFSLLIFSLMVCYSRAVWSRIPFAAATLRTAVTAVQSNMGLTFVAVVMLVLGAGWVFIWSVGARNALTDSNRAVIFALLVSFYWVQQVLTNIVHVTTAGTVATWWYIPLEAVSCWSRAIQDSFYRATTYSFGSICFGSLVVALVQALRQMAHMARNNEDMKLLACILECILRMIEDIIEYFNKWAYVYVGIYGFPYLEAGRNVIALFQSKGWSVIISDNLCDRVLFVVSLCIGLLSGMVGPILSALLGAGAFNEVSAFLFVFGLLSGFIFSSIMLSVVSSAVNTVIVCYAEAPAEFERNHPRLSGEMREAWRAAWPTLNISS